MTDEELAKAIETPAPEEPASPAGEPEKETPVEAPAKEEVQPEGEEPEKEPAEEEEAPISRREQLRVNALLQKYPALKDRPEVQRQAPVQRQDDILQNLEADPEVLEQLQANRKSYSDEAYLEGLRQSEIKEWKRDLKYEAPVVEEAYPFLNPKDTENFKPAAAEAMNQKYLRFIGYNPGDLNKGIPETVQYPDVSYREFVEGEMEFVDELANQKVAETTKNIAKQAASTGLRPDGSSAKRMNLNQAPESMSIEELYASIGQTAPKAPKN